MKKGYPIKYAVEELRTNDGFQNGYNEIIEGYIVSKCYVTNSKISYYGVIEPVITHEVVFPFVEFEKFKYELGKAYDEEPLLPSRGANGEASNNQTVCNLYDTFESARKEAEILNECLRKSEVSKLSLIESNWREKHKKILEEFKKRMQVCSLYESYISSQTQNLEISKTEHPILSLKSKK